MNRATHRLTLAIGLTASTFIFAPPSSAGDLDQVEKDSWSKKADVTTTAKTTAAKETRKPPQLDEAHIAAVLKDARTKTPPEDSSKDSAAKKDGDTRSVAKKEAITDTTSKEPGKDAAVKKDADATSRDNKDASIAAAIEEAREIPSVSDARNTAALIEIKRLRDDLKNTQSKVQDLESRTAASAFTPPASIDLGKDKQIDPVNNAYPVAVGKALRLAQVHFNSNSIELSPSAERLTREAAEWLKTLSTKKIIVAGFSDTIGPADVNKKISKMRATKVAALLERAGIDPSMIEIVGSGEEGLPQKTGDNVAEPMNRCVGIIAIPDDSQS